MERTLVSLIPLRIARTAAGSHLIPCLRQAGAREPAHAWPAEERLIPQRLPAESRTLREVVSRVLGREGSGENG